MKRIIFLDFDGVLNTPKNWGKRPLIHAITPELVKRVSNFRKEIDAHIVIASTWRKHFDIAEIQFMLEHHGFENAEYVIDYTPILEQQRQYEIMAWLQEHNDVENYVILDDNTGEDPDWDLVDNHWVRVNFEVGLQYDDLHRAKEILRTVLYKNPNCTINHAGSECNVACGY